MEINQHVICLSKARIKSRQMTHQPINQIRLISEGLISAHLITLRLISSYHISSHHFSTQSAQGRNFLGVSLIRQQSLMSQWSYNNHADIVTVVPYLLGRGRIKSTRDPNNPLSPILFQGLYLEETTVRCNGSNLHLHLVT